MESRVRVWPLPILVRLSRPWIEGWYPYTHPFNLTGHPALTVPAGWTHDGLPVGLQLVGGYLSDAQLLGVARTYELARPWHDRYLGLEPVGSAAGVSP